MRRAREPVPAMVSDRVEGGRGWRGVYGQRGRWRPGDEGWPTQMSLEHRNESSVSGLRGSAATAVSSWQQLPEPDAMRCGPGVKCGGAPTTKKAERRGDGTGQQSGGVRTAEAGRWTMDDGDGGERGSIASPSHLVIPPALLTKPEPHLVALLLYLHTQEGHPGVWIGQ